MRPDCDQRDWELERLLSTVHQGADAEPGEGPLCTPSTREEARRIGASDENPHGSLREASQTRNVAQCDTFIADELQQVRPERERRDPVLPIAGLLVLPRERDQHLEALARTAGCLASR
jgi:hypothetical protein